MGALISHLPYSQQKSHTSHPCALTTQQKYLQKEQAKVPDNHSSETVATISSYIWINSQMQMATQLTHSPCFNA